MRSYFFIWFFLFLLLDFILLLPHSFFRGTWSEALISFYSPLFSHFSKTLQTLRFQIFKKYLWYCCISVDWTTIAYLFLLWFIHNWRDYNLFSSQSQKHALSFKVSQCFFSLCRSHSKVAVICEARSFEEIWGFSPYACNSRLLIHCFSGDYLLPTAVSGDIVKSNKKEWKKEKTTRLDHNLNIISLFSF